MRIIDISQPLGTGTAVWPGDQPFELAWSMRQDRGDSVNVAVLKLSAHTGTHTDGGFHVSSSGIKPNEMPLASYIGPVTVVDVRGRAALDETALSDVDLTVTRRILFRTRDAVDPAEFPAKFLAPTPALAHQLVASGVKLVGSDAPSMDDVDSKTLDSHHVFADAGVATIENLVLNHVEPGEYILIALPLKLVEADSSPVRAVLIEGKLDG
jgi:arylformamidase